VIKNFLERKASFPRKTQWKSFFHKTLKEISPENSLSVALSSQISLENYAKSEKKYYEKSTPGRNVFSQLSATCVSKPG
jgi:hypothetical protein